MAELLEYGPLTTHTVHLCLDMQNLFAEDTPWHTPWMKRVLPVIHRIAERHRERTVFTRFIPPVRPEEMAGTWRRYYERWRDLTRERLDPRLLDLIGPLAELVPPATVIDKQFYSAFSQPELNRLLRQRGTDSLVITGAETDVCVLATIMDALDLGYRIVLPTDALCGSSDRTHDALMTLYRERYAQQIETTRSETVLECWLTDDGKR
jgi:nicotinamidase-related amidase